jgi:hypothetical protein
MRNSINTKPLFDNTQPLFDKWLAVPNNGNTPLKTMAREWHDVRVPARGIRHTTPGYLRRGVMHIPQLATFPLVDPIFLLHTHSRLGRSRALRSARSHIVPNALAHNMIHRIQGRRKVH